MSALAVLAVSLSAASAQIYQWTTIAGLAGQPGSADGTNGTARFRRPQGVAVDEQGNLFVTDTDNSTIRRLTLVGTNWLTTTIAGLAGSPGSADGTNSGARFDFCSGVASSGSSAFVADTLNHTIRMITPVGTNWVVSTIAGQAGSPGSEDGTNSAARFSYPSGVAVGADYLQGIFVADTGNSTIRVIVPLGTNWIVSTLAGVAGSPGSADGTNGAARFQWPCAVAVFTQQIPPLPPDFYDYVFVADTWNSTVRELDYEGGFFNLSPVRTLAGLAGMTGSDNGTNQAARFYTPAGIAVALWNPNLFVADWRNHTIRRLTAPGARWGYPPLATNWLVSTIGGLPGNPGYADGTNSEARFYSPQSIAADEGGHVFVVDTENHTIRMGVTLAGPPVIQSVTKVNGVVYLTWSAATERLYEVQYKTNLTQANWISDGGHYFATGSTLTFFQAAVSPYTPTDPQRFYRIVLLP